LVSLWAGGGITLLFFLFMVDRMVDAEILHRFDDGLINRARAIAAALDVPERTRADDAPGQEIEDERDEESDDNQTGEVVLRELPAVGAGPESVRFAVWAADGRLVFGSKPPIDRPPGDASSTTRFFDLQLADMGLARAVAIPVQLNPGEATAGPDGLLMIAQSRRDLDALLGRIDEILLGAVIATIVVSSVVVMMSVMRSLRPLGTLAGYLDAISLEAPPQGLKFAGLPAELSPLAARFAALYERLVLGLERERRFSRDVAHELRTPLAEIRTVADVALEAQNSVVVREALIDARASALEMQNIVESLLSMARLEAGIEALTDEPVDLIKMVRAIISKESARGGVDGLRVHDLMPAEGWIMTDASLLERILANLVANAFAHAPPDTVIAVSYREHSLSGVFEITNVAPELAVEDLPHLTERFWQKSGPSYRKGRHTGLGLSLVNGLCQLLGVRLCFTLVEGARLVVTIAGLRLMSAV
jgi:two-component system sensor histidine kinase QseC